MKPIIHNNCSGIGKIIRSGDHWIIILKTFLNLNLSQNKIIEIQILKQILCN